MFDLTIGMATFDDAEGVWWTICALREMHDLAGVELLVVDNNPASGHGQTIAKWIPGMIHGRDGGAVGRYVAFPEPQGTAPPRNAVFELAQAPYVCCIDPHVLLRPGAVAALRAYYRNHPETSDLLSGPMVYEDRQQMSTHFNANWGAGMKGQWDYDPRGRGTEPFEIPAMGLGLFSCRKAAWAGFNPAFRKFGGEEWYLHDKFRQRGDQCLCLPQLQWIHRFLRIGNALPYVNTNWHKCRNYVIGHRELGQDLAPIKAHFVPGMVSEAEWQRILSGADDPVGGVVSVPVQGAPSLNAGPPLETHRAQPPAGATLDQIYEWCKGTPRDLDQHLPKLRELAEQCDHVTEITKRRESTVGLLAGRPADVVSYQRELDALLPTLAQAITADAVGKEGQRRVERHRTFLGGDSANMPTIDPTDLLFIDSVMSGERLTHELQQHAGQVRRFLAVTGTGAFGDKAENGGDPGLFAALRPLVEGGTWRPIYHTVAEYGLTVLSRHPADWPAEPVHVWPPGQGPGTELTAIFAALGIEPSASCDCKSKALAMDVWGVEECKKRREEIVGWLRDGQGRWGWTDKLKAAAKAVASGLAFRLDWSDPFPSLVDEAIRRAEQKTPRG